MKLRTIVILIAACAGLASQASAQSVVAGPFVNPANGHRYVLLSSSTWTQANAFAPSLGGYLATINDAAEQTFVNNTFAPLLSDPVMGYWIGFNDRVQEGTFVWANGEPVTYLNWTPGEPNALPGEHYVNVWGPSNTTQPPGRWNDLVNTIPINAVVEIPPFTTLWSTLDCGGGDLSGGAFGLKGTIGQTDAAIPILTGGEFRITLGYWARDPGAPPCVADYDDGTGTGTPDGGVTIDDLLYYLGLYDSGSATADVDDGSFTGIPDGGVTIDDLLYFLLRFASGC